MLLDALFFSCCGGGGGDETQPTPLLLPLSPPALPAPALPLYSIVASPNCTFTCVEEKPTTTLQQEWELGWAAITDSSD
jgi:hypothetical protein